MELYTYLCTSLAWWIQLSLETKPYSWWYWFDNDDTSAWEMRYAWTRHSGKAFAKLGCLTYLPELLEPQRDKVILNFVHSYILQFGINLNIHHRFCNLDGNTIPVLLAENAIDSIDLCHFALYMYIWYGYYDEMRNISAWLSMQPNVSYTSILCLHKTRPVSIGMDSHAFGNSRQYKLWFYICEYKNKLPT